MLSPSVCRKVALVAWGFQKTRRFVGVNCEMVITHYLCRYESAKLPLSKRKGKGEFCVNLRWFATPQDGAFLAKTLLKCTCSERIYQPIRRFFKVTWNSIPTILRNALHCAKCSAHQYRRTPNVQITHTMFCCQRMYANPPFFTHNCS